MLTPYSPKKPFHPLPASAFLGQSRQADCNPGWTGIGAPFLGPGIQPPPPQGIQYSSPP